MQGLWQMDFPALRRFCRGQKRLARDLAGNAFSTTVCTAVVIGSLCHLRLADDMLPEVFLRDGAQVPMSSDAEMPARKVPRLSVKRVETRGCEQGMRPSDLTDGLMGFSNMGSYCKTGQRDFITKNGVRLVTGVDVASHFRMRRPKLNGYRGTWMRRSPGNCEKRATSLRSRGRGRALHRGVASLVACGPRLARLRRFAKDAGVARRGKKSAQHLLGDVKGI